MSIFVCLQQSEYYVCAVCSFQKKKGGGLVLAHTKRRLFYLYLHHAEVRIHPYLPWEMG